MAESYPTVLSRVTATKECVLQWIRDGENIRPPQQVFQEEVNILNDSIRKDRDLMGSSRDPDQLSSAFDRAVRCGGKLRELQIEYEATASQREESYQQSLEAHLGGLAKEIVDTLGIRLIDQALQFAQSDPNNPITKRRAGRKRRRPASPIPEESSQRRLRSGLNRTEEEPAISIASRRKRKDVDAITSPVAGEIYQAYRHNSKSWSAVLLLPLGDLTDIGLTGTLKDTGLLNDEIPQCYKYNKRSKKIVWQDAFEDNGTSIIGRQFPVLFFDDQPKRFQEQCEFGWVAATDLKEFNPEDTSVHLLSNYKLALDFYKHRHPAKDLEMQEEQETMADSGSQAEQHLRYSSGSANDGSLNSVATDPCLSSITVLDSEFDKEEIREDLELPDSDKRPENHSQDLDSHETLEALTSDGLGNHQGLDHKQYLGSMSTRALAPEELSHNSPSEKIPSVPVSPTSSEGDYQRNLDENDNRNERTLGSETIIHPLVEPQEDAREGTQSREYPSLVNMTPPATEIRENSAENDNTYITRLCDREPLSGIAEQNDQDVGGSDSIEPQHLVPLIELERPEEPANSGVDNQSRPSVTVIPLESQQQLGQDLSNGTNVFEENAETFPSAKGKQQDMDTRALFPATLAQNAIGALGLINSHKQAVQELSSSRPQSSPTGVQMTQVQARESASAAMATQNTTRTRFDELAHALNPPRQHVLNNNFPRTPFPPMNTSSPPASSQYQTGTPWIPGGTQQPKITVMQPLMGGYSGSNFHPMGQGTTPPRPRPGSLVTDHPPVSYQPHQPGGWDYRGSPISMPTPTSPLSFTPINMNPREIHRVAQPSNETRQKKDHTWIQEHLTPKSNDTFRFTIQRNENGVYPCPYCSKGYPRFLEFEAHITRNHKGYRVPQPTFEAA